VPFESDPFDSGLCSICYFYKTGLPVTEFWRLHDEGYFLAPYNIGARCTKTELDFNKLINGNWRQALKEQVIIPLGEGQWSGPISPPKVEEQQG
jgi:hypothetical protein